MGVKRDHRFKFFCLGFMNSIENPKQSFVFWTKEKKALFFVERERARFFFFFFFFVFFFVFFFFCPVKDARKCRYIAAEHVDQSEVIH